MTKTKTPEWLKLGRSISDLESGGGGGGGGGGGDGGSESGEALAVSQKNSEKGTKASDEGDGGGVAAADKEDSSTPMKVLQGVTMFAAAAGIAAIEMGVLGGPKEDEAER